MTFVQKRPRSGVFRYRRRVPAHLQGVIGKTELIFSLETKDRREAIRRGTARNLVVEHEYFEPAEKAVEWGVSLATARQRISAASQPVSSFDAGVLPEAGAYQTSLSLQLDDSMRFGEGASAWREAFWSALEWGLKAHSEASDAGLQGEEHLAAYRSSLLRQAKEEAQTAQGGTLEGSAGQTHGWPLTELASYRRFMQLAEVGLRAGLATGDLRVLEPLARKRLRELGADPDAASAAVQAMTVELARARLKAVEMILRRTEGDPVETPTATDPAANRFFLDDAFAVWSRLNTPGDGSKAEAQIAVRQFDELHGRLSVSSITRAHVRAYRDALEKVPKVRKGGELKMTLPQLADVGAKDLNRPRISGRSILKRLGLLKAMVQTAHDEDAFQAGDAWGNPFARITVAESDWTSRRPFSDADLTAIFQELADPTISSGRQFGLARGLLPLLSLCVGTRISELATLRVRDVMRHGDSWFLSINEDDPDKQLKTQGSRRVVPLHPLLLTSGLLETVALARKSDGDDARLFPDVETQGAGRGPAAPFVQWFSRFLRNDVGITDELKTLHSFRHTFKTACRGAGLPEDVSDYFTGHADQKVSRRYGEFPLPQLAATMARVIFPEDALRPILKLTHADALRASSDTSLVATFSSPRM